MMKQKIASYYRVLPDLRNAPVNQYLMHGFETKHDYLSALKKLVERWKDRVGEVVGERNDFLLLRFHDTPGGKPDEAWLPIYLLEKSEPPAYLHSEKPDPTDRKLNDAFGFD